MSPIEHRHDRFELVYFFLVAIDTTVALAAIFFWLAVISGHWAYLAGWAVVAFVICSPLRPYVWALRHKDRPLLRITAEELTYKNNPPIPLNDIQGFEPTSYKLRLTYGVDDQSQPRTLTIYPLTPAERDKLEAVLNQLGQATPR